PERLVTDTFKFTSAALSTIASESEEPAELSASPTAVDSSVLLRNTGADPVRGLPEAISSSPAFGSVLGVTFDREGRELCCPSSYDRLFCRGCDEPRPGVPVVAEDSSGSSRLSKTEPEDREEPGGAFAGIILTLRPELPPLVFLIWLSRSKGPTFVCDVPLSPRSLPAKTTELFPGYV